MSPTRLHHVTLSSGRVLRLVRAQADDAAVAAAAALLPALLERQEPPLPRLFGEPGATVSAASEAGGLLCTVSARDGAPILTTGVGSRSRHADLWPILHDLESGGPPPGTARARPPPPPWAADVLGIGLELPMTDWTGRWSVALAWAWQERPR